MDQAKQTRDGRPRRAAGHSVPGVISIHDLYRIEEAKARLGWTDSALRAARRRGLRLIACGKRRYVTGQEILRFLESLESNT